MEVPEEPVTELLQLDQEAVRGTGLPGHPDTGASLMSKFQLLIEDACAVDLGARNEKQLFVVVGCQLSETRFQEQRAHDVTAGLRTSHPLCGLQLLDAGQQFHHPVQMPTNAMHPRGAVLLRRSGKGAQQSVTAAGPALVLVLEP
jgi:hypothetical protein